MPQLTATLLTCVPRRYFRHNFLVKMPIYALFPEISQNFANYGSTESTPLNPALIAFADYNGSTLSIRCFYQLLPLTLPEVYLS